MRIRGVGGRFRGEWTSSGKYPAARASVAGPRAESACGASNPGRAANMAGRTHPPHAGSDRSVRCRAFQISRARDDATSRCLEPMFRTVSYLTRKLRHDKENTVIFLVLKQPLTSGRSSHEHQGWCTRHPFVDAPRSRTSPCRPDRGAVRDQAQCRQTRTASQPSFRGSDAASRQP